MAVFVVDFDGTCVADDFPAIGAEIGAIKVLKKLVARGHKLIIFTMRSDVENPISSEAGIVNKKGQHLTNAVHWFHKNGIPLYGIQTNPTQSSWTTSPKAHGDVFIDDRALGAPLKYDLSVSDKPYLDWIAIEMLLVEKGYIE